MSRTSEGRPFVSTGELGWLAGAFLAVVVLIAVVGWALIPARAGIWIVITTTPGALWAAFEYASLRHANGPGKAGSGDRPWVDETLRFYRICVIVVCALIALEAGPELAAYAGLMEGDWLAFFARVRGVFLGFALAVFGNRLPRFLSPWHRTEEPFDWHGVHRFVGRVMVLGGVLLIGIWMTLPVLRAEELADLVIICACGTALARKIGSVVRYSLGGGDLPGPPSPDGCRS